MTRVANFLFILHVTLACFFIFYGKINEGNEWWGLLPLFLLSIYIAFIISRELIIDFSCFDRRVLRSSLITWGGLLTISIIAFGSIGTPIDLATLLMRGEDNAAWVNQASGLYHNKGILLNPTSSEFYDYGVGGVYLGYILFIFAGETILQANSFSAPIMIVGLSLLSYLTYSSLALLYIFNLFYRKESVFINPYFYGSIIGALSVMIVCIALLPLAVHVGFLSLVAVSCYILWVIFFIILKIDFPTSKFSNVLFIPIGYMAGQSWPFIFPVLAIFFIGCIILKFKNIVIPLILFSLAFFIGGWEQLLTAISDRGGLVRLANTNGGSWSLPFFEYLNAVFAVVAMAMVSMSRQIEKRYIAMGVAFLGFYIFYFILINISPYARYTQSKIMLSGFAVGYSLIFIILSKSRIGVFSILILIASLAIMKIPPYSMPYEFYSKIKMQSDNELVLAISKINFDNLIGERIICKPDFDRSSYDNYYCARWVAAFSPRKSVEDRAYRNIVIRSNSENWNNQKLKYDWIEAYEDSSIDYRLIN